MKLTVNKNYTKAKKVCVPGNEHIWFEAEPILKRETLKVSSPAVKQIRRGNKTEQEFDSEIFFENQFELVMKKIKNFGGVEDSETGKALPFSKDNLKMLLESSWDFEVCERVNKKGEPLLDEETNEPLMMGLGEWLYKSLSETKSAKHELKN